MKNLKVERQKFALTKILEVEDSKRKEYKTRVESLGMIIYKNNLIGALAYMESKNKTLYQHVFDWLKQYPLININDTNLLNELVTLDSFTLMAITEEVLLLSDALKEFVKAEYKTS